MKEAHSLGAIALWRAVGRRRDKETSKLGGVGKENEGVLSVFSPPRVYHCPFPFFSLTFISL